MDTYPGRSGGRGAEGSAEELVVLAVGEPHERQVVPGKRFRRREVLVRRIVLDVLEVRRVVVRGEVWDDGRHAVADSVEVPLVVLEERVLHDLLHAILPEPALPVRQEPADEALGHLGHLDVVGELEGVLMVHDLVVGPDQGVRVEGWVPNQHLVKEHAHAPPVALPPVLAGPALGLEHLRGDVVRGPDSCLRPNHPVRTHLHAGTEVRQLQVPLGVQQHVVGFNVPGKYE